LHFVCLSSSQSLAYISSTRCSFFLSSSLSRSCSALSLQTSSWWRLDRMNRRSSHWSLANYHKHILKARHLRLKWFWDDCPLGLELVVKDKPTDGIFCYTGVPSRKKLSQHLLRPNPDNWGCYNVYMSEFGGALYYYYYSPPEQKRCTHLSSLYSYNMYIPPSLV
jgi:hypothetical protein